MSLYTVHPFLQTYFHSINCEVHRENRNIRFEKSKKNHIVNITLKKRST